MVNELLSSLVQVRIFNKRTKLLNLFASLSNDSLRANLSFWVCSRIFGAYLSFMVLSIFVIGLMIGISNIENASSEATRATLAGLYGEVINLQRKVVRSWPGEAYAVEMYNGAGHAQFRLCRAALPERSSASCGSSSIMDG